MRRGGVREGAKGMATLARSDWGQGSVASSTCAPRLAMSQVVASSGGSASHQPLTAAPTTTVAGATELDDRLVRFVVRIPHFFT